MDSVIQAEKVLEEAALSTLALDDDQRELIELIFELHQRGDRYYWKYLHESGWGNKRKAAGLIERQARLELLRLRGYNF